MYIESTGELTGDIAKLPEQLEQPRVTDLVLGQYALLDIDAIWVNEEGEVRVDSRAELESVESSKGYEDYIKIILIEQGIVLDPIDDDGDITARFTRTPISELTDDEDFDFTLMLPVTWVIANYKQLAELKTKYKEQTGKELYQFFGIQATASALQPPKSGKLKQAIKNITNRIKKTRRSQKVAISVGKESPS